VGADQISEENVNIIGIPSLPGALFLLETSNAVLIFTGGISSDNESTVLQRAIIPSRKSD
jgi:hypothetical protein